MRKGPPVLAQVVRAPATTRARFPSRVSCCPWVLIQAFIQHGRGPTACQALLWPRGQVPSGGSLLWGSAGPWRTSVAALASPTRGQQQLPPILTVRSVSRRCGCSAGGHPPPPGENHCPRGIAGNTELVF